TTVRGYDLPEPLGSWVVLASAVLSPDGQRLLTTYEGICTLRFKNGTTRAYTDRVAHVWEAKTGRFLHSLRGHTERITAATFSPAGRRILTASNDRTARLWDASTGREILCLRGHQAPLAAAVFSPDGGRVLTLATSRYASRGHYPQSRPGEGPV